MRLIDLVTTLRTVTVEYHRNGNKEGSDIGIPLIKDHDGNMYVVVNGDHLHPVKGVQSQRAVKDGIVRINWS